MNALLLMGEGWVKNGSDWLTGLGIFFCLVLGRMDLFIKTGNTDLRTFFSDKGRSFNDFRYGTAYKVYQNDYK